jgi:hypothetical protein
MDLARRVDLAGRHDAGVVRLRHGEGRSAVTSDSPFAVRYKPYDTAPNGSGGQIVWLLPNEAKILLARGKVFERKRFFKEKRIEWKPGQESWWDAVERSLGREARTIAEAKADWDGMLLQYPWDFQDAERQAEMVRRHGAELAAQVVRGLA